MGSCDSERRCVFVGNIPYGATEEQLIQICEEVGPVVSFRLVIDKETGKPKGYGFCEYKDEETALSARRNLQGYEIHGRKLRVQGRGGPGMVTSVDPKKHIGRPAVPIGMSVAEAVMARALGAAHTVSLFSHSGVDDPLTLYMSKLSKSYLNDVMSEFNTMCTQNKEETRQLLLAIPNLSKALFQAQLILGMVTLPNIPQPAAPQLQPDSQPTQFLPGLPPHPPVLPQARPQIQLPQPAQTQILQSHLPAPSGIPPSMQPQVNLSINPPLQMVTPSSVKQQMQPAFLQQAGQVASTNFSYNQLGTTNTHYHPPSLTHPLLSEQGFQGNPSAVSAVLDNMHKGSRRCQAPNNSSLMTKPAYSSALPEVKRGATNNLDHLSRPSKLPRLNDGTNYVSPGASVSTSLSGPSTQVSAAEEVSNSDKLASQPQLPLEIESGLLQQVLSLTPEQLSSLPSDQKQQVIQLQQMLQLATQPNS